MSDLHDRRALALGLMRKAMQLLEEARASRDAATVRAAIATMLIAQPLRAEDEIAPDAATLLAAIPLE